MTCVRACARLLLCFWRLITGRRFFISIVGILMRIFPFFHNLAIRFLEIVIFSGAPAAPRVAKRSPIVITGKKRKPMKDFLMVIMASGIARGRVRTTTTTTTTESRNVAAILQKIGWQRHTALVYRVLLWYWTPCAMINWHLSKQVIRWPVSRDHIAGSSLQLIEVTCCFKVDRWPSVDFPIGSRAHVRLTCWKQGKVVLAGLRTKR